MAGHESSSVDLRDILANLQGQLVTRHLRHCRLHLLDREVMGLPSPEASFKHHDALLGRAALSEEVGDLVAFGFPLRKMSLLNAFEGWSTMVNQSKNKNRNSVLLKNATNASSHCRSPMRRILAKKCHNRLVPKLLHVRPDLFEQIHGRDVCRAWNCSACSVLPAQVDHNHILLIPKL